MSGGRVDAGPRGALPSRVGPAEVSYRRRLGHVGLVFAAVPSAGAARGCVQLRRDPNIEKPNLQWTKAPGDVSGR